MNVYIVKADGKTIYNDIHLSDSFKAINPKLFLKDNAAGSFEITLPPGNVGYDSVERMISEIVIYRQRLVDGVSAVEEIWSGRVVSERKDFQNNRILVCEGELAYLNDTTQPPKVYENITVRDFLDALLVRHNYIDDDTSKPRVPESKRFTIGAVDVVGGTENLIPYRMTNNETTLDAITQGLLGIFGGHLVIRKEEGVRYLDYFAELPNINRQTIRFGRNLLDFTRDWDMSQIATVVMARGARLEKNPEGHPPDLEAYLDVSSVNGGSRYITNEPMVAKYGWIEAVIDFGDITDAQTLKDKSVDYLNNIQYEEMVLEVSAIDLRYLDVNAGNIKLLDGVRVISRAHVDGGVTLDRIFPVTELTIQLDKPDSGVYTMGSKVTGSFTSSQKTVNQTIVEKINNLPSKNSILETARDNANQLINQVANGYITITKTTSSSGVHSEALIVSNNSTYETSTKCWKWTVNGLGYFTRPNIGASWSNPSVAITMDGAVTADSVVTNALSTVKIQTGLIYSADSPTLPNVVFNMMNSSQNIGATSYPAGSLTIRNGEIRLGVSTGRPLGAFWVKNSGEIYAENGTIAGFRITPGEWVGDVWRPQSIYNDILNLNDNGLDFYDGALKLGSYGTQHWGLEPTKKGMSTSMEYNTSYITWAHKENTSTSSYTIKLMYTSKSLAKQEGGSFAADRVHLGCSLDANGWITYNFWLDPNTGGVNGGVTFTERLRLGTVDASGHVTGYIDCRIRNGVILP